MKTFLADGVCTSIKEEQNLRKKGFNELTNEKKVFRGLTSLLERMEAEKTKKLTDRRKVSNSAQKPNRWRL